MDSFKKSMSKDDFGRYNQDRRFGMLRYGDSNPSKGVQIWLPPKKKGHFIEILDDLYVLHGRHE